jgi:TldD protein
MITTVDADFLALPLEKTSDAAISTATGAGASHVDVRIERTRTGLLSLRDAKPETQSDETNFGIGVRVIVNGAWGFASSPDVSVETAQKLAMTAVAIHSLLLMRIRRIALHHLVQSCLQQRASITPAHIRCM